MTSARAWSRHGRSGPDAGLSVLDGARNRRTSRRNDGDGGASAGGGWWRRFRQWRRSRPFWGGALSILAGAWIIYVPHASLTVMIHEGIAGVPASLMGILMALMGLSMWIAPQYSTMAGICTILFAISSLILSNLGGFFIGLLLGIIGGALGFAWMPTPATPAPATPTPVGGDPEVAPADTTARPAPSADAAAPTAPLPPVGDPATPPEATAPEGTPPEAARSGDRDDDRDGRRPPGGGSTPHGRTGATIRTAELRSGDLPRARRRGPAQRRATGPEASRATRSGGRHTRGLPDLAQLLPGWPRPGRIREPLSHRSRTTRRGIRAALIAAVAAAGVTGMELPAMADTPLPVPSPSFTTQAPCTSSPTPSSSATGTASASPGVLAPNLLPGAPATTKGSVPVGPAPASSAPGQAPATAAGPTPTKKATNPWLPPWLQWLAAYHPGDAQVVPAAATSALPTGTATRAPATAATSAATPGVYPCVSQVPVAPSGQAGLVGETGGYVIKTNLLVINGMKYNGVKDVQTANGPVPALEFQASSLDIHNLDMYAPWPGGLWAHFTSAPNSTSTFRDGEVTLYTTKMQGNLFGLIPITFTPKSPPPLVVPTIIFTNATVTNIVQTGGTLTVPGLNAVVTPTGPPSS